MDYLFKEILLYELFSSYTAARTQRFNISFRTFVIYMLCVYFGTIKSIFDICEKQINISLSGIKTDIFSVL